MSFFCKQQQQQQQQQQPISYKEIVFRFRRDIQILGKAVVLTSCEWEVPGWGRFVLIPRFAPHRSAKLPEPEVFRPGEVRRSSEAIVK